jgi:CheY-like chemotaxis protein
MISKIVKTMLENLKCKVDTAATGQEGLDLYLNGNNYQMILTDLNLPDISGLAISKKIREIEAQKGGHIPIIALTGYATEEDKQNCIDAGMDHYITKPANEDDFKGILKAYHLK